MDTDDVHKHYRGLAVGYTATIISLCILQVSYLLYPWTDKAPPHFLRTIPVSILGLSLDVPLFNLSLATLLITVLLCVLSQFLFFKGYLAMARGDTSKANKKYFGPNDKSIRHIFYFFLFGTALTLLVVTRWVALVTFTIFFFFWTYYRNSEKWLSFFAREKRGILFDLPRRTFNFFFFRKAFETEAIAREGASATESLKNQIRISIQKLRKHILRALKFVFCTSLASIAINFLIQKIGFHISHDVKILMRLSGYCLILWGVLSPLGYPIRTIDGETLPEVFDEEWHKLVYSVGLFLLLLS